MKKSIAIVGPTAVGKSALGLKLAQKFDGEIISGDSMQIYRHLDIGTAKDSPEELAAVPHHLVDICDVSQRYTVKDFQENAEIAIDSIISQGKTPFIVGGTGFYLNSLLKNLHLGGNNDSDPNLREQLLKQEKEQGIESLQTQLISLDPVAAKSIDMDNPRRVIRAIEVFKTTGRSIVEQDNGDKIADFKIIGLTDDRQKLYDRINQRVDKMVEMGLLAEAKQVYEHQDEIPQAKNGIGYKELFPYFAHQADLDSCLIELKKNSRHFAKRQLTYFRNQMDVDWYNITEQPDYYQSVVEDIQKFLLEK
ncbi:tRNA (adenosine(37)-N6)-dimethylallyltransferase MiaA [Companilactobacillus sp.]|uniref:tRNA (adenosine(37)-N6)-dimethylallyltransferase MiaA n=1 Tax=Companilactobacillus sp. TaxID=2767905 RepID=UPI0025BF44EE|nr:tRNA (adenosine(37)-N6)-dimethylallyltransferase MiaA [Companilactobacillus sp.]MCH4008014.1 tRNA (adenosine(37)-N6)-dimethylallyltransferase MiaA [Companilactobacillus sp.]MCH4051807.1 tRNA (adenosine(37)-N6)-dimethylallyltransferase MiaA [Companilactobacillus sp.]MCH4075957.1 tRNA (adenosine(37)-N6)-dimethylallyltransferase MiaA [Companilactobacillus sp.]MCH4124532.1 tRNA (adenosine(37)-N6)-dimethylallyltransferase MiaA [Companilactobacillus sp.]MCH4132505.1 tRNA (adenosine(37)-N6)-dimeth